MYLGRQVALAKQTAANQSYDYLQTLWQPYPYMYTIIANMYKITIYIIFN